MGLVVVAEEHTYNKIVNKKQTVQFILNIVIVTEMLSARFTFLWVRVLVRGIP